MTRFNLRLSAFSICWLRAYDFGLEPNLLDQAVVNLRTTCPLVTDLRHVASEKEIDDVDRRMFDVRYQERSNLVRIGLHPFNLANQKLGEGRNLSAPITVNLLLDLASGFGVLNLCLPRTDAYKADAYTLKEAGFLTRQWLLFEEMGQPQRLKIQLPLSDQVASLYIREAMNYYFLHLHKALWKVADPQRRNPLPALDDFPAWMQASHEADPMGCESLRELNQLGLTRSIFPTSFGPVVDLWGIEGTDPDRFDADAFSAEYVREIAWLFTDGQRDSLGESLHNERQTKSLALFVWPNHALCINQNRNALTNERIRMRVKDYGCLDVEVVRILEILNLQSALLHAFDRQLDQELEKISSQAAQDQRAVIRITEQHRHIARSMRSFDFFNLFHTAYWEPLYARLLENPRLRFNEATKLVELKSKRLEEEIQQAVIIQDRTRQQQEREQELDVLRGLHSLSLANDIQSNALLIINFVVSATASFGFTEVLSPWLTRLSGARPSFPEAYPLAWIGLNIGTFVLVAFVLARLSKSLIRLRSQITELDGRLNFPINAAHLEAYLANHRDLEYFHLDADEQSGYIRIRKPYGVLLLEFDRKQFYRFVLFWQGGKLLDPESMKRIYVEQEIKKLRDQLLLESAKRVLAKNDLGLYTKPSPGLYPHQWNWDSAFIGIGISHYHLKRAEAEIRSLLRGQWQNGMIPQIIYAPDTSGYFPNPERWEIKCSQDAPSDVEIRTSGITQPPMITIAVWEMTCRSLNTAFVREVYPALLDYHRWFHRERDPNSEGLVSIIHPWESGLDNSPRWVETLNRITLTVRPTYQREDNQHVSSNERPSDADYDRFVYLMDLARDLKYSQQDMLAHSPFVVQDVLVNSILFRADDCLRMLARMIGKPTAEIERWMELTRQAFDGKLWHDADGMYYDYDVRGASLIQENTIAGFLPLYGRLVNDERARLMVERHLLKPAEYSPDSRSTKFRLPSTSKGSRYYESYRYWRGPIWVNTNWLIIRGLMQYGHFDLARQIREDTLMLIAQEGFREYFDPYTGVGYGTNTFSWSAALVIDLLADRRLV